MDHFGKTAICLILLRAMQLSKWTKELYRQWMIARKQPVRSYVRNFRRGWEQLLHAADIGSAIDRKNAQREAERADEAGFIKLHRDRKPQYIRRLELLPSGEIWLRGLVKQRPPMELVQESLHAVDAAAAMAHPRLPDQWKAWCEATRSLFEAGKSKPPLFWKDPERVEWLLRATFRLTARDWGKEALVRDISVEIELDNTKQLEREHRAVEACLSQLYGRRMTLQNLGIELTHSQANIAGLLILHFQDGTRQSIDRLKDLYAISFHDLDRTERIETRAQRLLTVENSKTTLRALAARNVAGDTLLVACSFPNRAVLRLISLLPTENFPHFHFGDTDPAGYAILSDLREKTQRSIQPFLMHRRECPKSKPLSTYDRNLLPGLLAKPNLEDVRETIRQFETTGTKGDFEQETLRLLPPLYEWPFYPFAKED